MSAVRADFALLKDKAGKRGVQKTAVFRRSVLRGRSRFGCGCGGGCGCAAVLRQGNGSVPGVHGGRLRHTVCQQKFRCAAEIQVCAGKYRKIAGQRDVRGKCDQPLGKVRVFPAFPQFFACRAGDSVRGGINSVQGAVLIQQFCRGYGADSGYAGYIIRPVAGERKKIQDLHRRYAPFFPDRFGGNRFPSAGFPRFQNRNEFPFQLHQIFIAGKDNARPFFGCAPCGQGCDYVVSLKSVLPHGPDAQFVQNFPDKRNLRMQIRGSRRTVGFVFRIKFVPERRPARIKGGGKISRFFCFEDGSQAPEKSEHGGNIFPVWVGQRSGAERIIRTVNQAVRIQDKNSVFHGNQYNTKRLFIPAKFPPARSGRCGFRCGCRSPKRCRILRHKRFSGASASAVR